MRSATAPWWWPATPSAPRSGACARTRGAPRARGPRHRGPPLAARRRTRRARPCSRRARSRCCGPDRRRTGQHHQRPAALCPQPLRRARRQRDRGGGLTCTRSAAASGSCQERLPSGAVPRARTTTSTRSSAPLDAAPKERPGREPRWCGHGPPAAPPGPGDPPRPGRPRRRRGARPDGPPARRRGGGPGPTGAPPPGRSRRCRRAAPPGTARRRAAARGPAPGPARRRSGGLPGGRAGGSAPARSCWSPPPGGRAAPGRRGSGWAVRRTDVQVSGA